MQRDGVSPSVNSRLTFAIAIVTLTQWAHYRSRSDLGLASMVPERVLAVPRAGSRGRVRGSHGAGSNRDR